MDISTSKLKKREERGRNKSENREKVIDYRGMTTEEVAAIVSESQQQIADKGIQIEEMSIEET